MALVHDLIDRYTHHPGGPEHRQITVLAGKARAYALDDDAVAALIWTLRNATTTVERNLDCLLPPPPDEPIWIEFSNAVRNAARTSVQKGGGEPDRVGYLFSSDGLSDSLALVTAWSLPEGDEGVPVYHSMTVGHLSTDGFGLQAYEARNLYSDDPLESLERIVGAATVTMPPGFEKEISVTADPAELSRMVFQSRHDLVSEIPFALAALVAVAAGAAGAGEPGDDAVRPTGVRRARPSAFRRLAEAAGLRRPTAGFRRIGRFADMRVAWDLPAGYREEVEAQAAGEYLPNDGASSSASESIGGQDSISSNEKSA